jgi:rubrerythrin
MSPDKMFFAYVVLCLTGMTVFGLYHEYRRRRFTPTPSQDHVFRCSNCAYVYTDDNDVARSRCPNCSTLNDEIQF